MPYLRPESILSGTWASLLTTMGVCAAMRRSSHRRAGNMRSAVSCILVFISTVMPLSIIRSISESMRARYQDSSSMPGLNIDALCPILSKCPIMSNPPSRIIRSDWSQKVSTTYRISSWKYVLIFSLNDSNRPSTSTYPLSLGTKWTEPMRQSSGRWRKQSEAGPHSGPRQSISMAAYRCMRSAWRVCSRFTSARYSVTLSWLMLHDECMGTGEWGVNPQCSMPASIAASVISAIGAFPSHHCVWLWKLQRVVARAMSAGLFICAHYFVGHLAQGCSLAFYLLFHRSDTSGYGPVATGIAHAH